MHNAHTDFTNMADNSDKIAKMARLLALTQIGVGILLICFGIADRTTTSFTGYIFFGIWIGVWMCVTGGLGIPGTSRERTHNRNCLTGIFMGFSITSAVMGGIIILFYSAQINGISQDDTYGYRDNHYNAQMAVSAFMLILGIAEFAIGIWAAICCCIMKPCCAQQQYQQVIDTANPGSHGIPVALPVSGTHGYQSPVVPIGAMGSGRAVPV